MGNFTGPETLARYWLMPFEPSHEAMTFKGSYPAATYFSLVTYDTNSNGAPVGVADGITDIDIAPDQGAANPFVTPNASGGSFTLVVSRADDDEENTIRIASDFGWILLRIYVPEADPTLSGQSLMGGVPLPAISVTANGETTELEPCWPVNTLTDIRAVLETFFPPGLDLIGDEGTPASDRLWFAPPTITPPLLLPNPDNKYVGMFPGNRYQPGRIVVIRGKAPTVRDVPDGSPVPAAEALEVRYWSLCSVDLILPVPAVGCISAPTAIVEDGHYTAVISNDLLRPDWLPSNVNWLPWGDEQYMKLVFFRNLLPEPNARLSIQTAMAAGCTFDFDLPFIPAREEVDRAGQCAQREMGEYYPVAAWCDKTEFVDGGWQACLEDQ
jgi:hypothetical protein